MKIDLLVDVRSDSAQPLAPARLPAIERCLARGAPVAVGCKSYAACLLDDFGLCLGEAAYAAIALAGEGDDPGEHYWLRADPISLRATMHRLTGGALPDDELDWSEARARAALLAPHLREDGCELVLKHPQRWYVRCPAPQRLHTSPPPRAETLLDEALLPSGPDGARWQRLMTEAQMLFFAAEVDQVREADRRLPVNGIWVWGGGQVPRIAQQPYAIVYSDDALALGLGQLSGATTAPLPNDARDLAAGDFHGSASRVLAAISAASLADMQALEEKWVAPLVSFVQAGQASELRLRMFRSNDVLGCRATRPLLRRWWRRARSLGAYRS